MPPSCSNTLMPPVAPREYQLNKWGMRVCRVHRAPLPPLDLDVGGGVVRGVALAAEDHLEVPVVVLVHHVEVRVVEEHLVQPAGWGGGRTGGGRAPWRRILRL